MICMLAKLQKDEMGSFKPSTTPCHAYALLPAS